MLVFLDTHMVVCSYASVFVSSDNSDQEFFGGGEQCMHVCMYARTYVMYRQVGRYIWSYIIMYVNDSG